MVRSRPEMTPDDSEPTKPRGWPTAYVSSPTWPAPPSTAGTIGCGGRSGTSTAMSLSGVGGDDLAVRPRAVDEGQPDRRRAVDHVERGQDRPTRVDDHPGAEPGAVPVRRRAARLDLHERGQDLLVDDRRGRRRRPQVLDRLLDDVRRDRPHVRPLERGLRRAARREADDHERHCGREKRRDPEPCAPPNRPRLPGG